MTKKFKFSEGTKTNDGWAHIPHNKTQTRKIVSAEHTSRIENRITPHEAIEVVASYDLFSPDDIVLIARNLTGRQKPIGFGFRDIRFHQKKNELQDILADSFLTFHDRNHLMKEAAETILAGGRL